jgi:hypothetical protein
MGERDNGATCHPFVDSGSRRALAQEVDRALANCLQPARFSDNHNTDNETLEVKTAAQTSALIHGESHVAL